MNIPSCFTSKPLLRVILKATSDVIPKFWTAMREGDLDGSVSSAKILKITIDTDINIIKVGITSSCTGEAVSQPEDSGCFRKSDGDPDENLKIQASNAKVMNQN